MNIQTVKTNLEKTIAGKELMLKGINDTTYGKIMAQFLEVNIDELKRILQDMEQCRPDWTPMNCPYAAAETCHRID
jgi:hypothetical protein